MGTAKGALQAMRAHASEEPWAGLGEMLCFLGALGTQEDPGTPLPFLDDLFGAQALLSGSAPSRDMGELGGGSLTLLFSWTPSSPGVCRGVYSSPLSWAEGTSLRTGPQDPGWVVSLIQGCPRARASLLPNRGIFAVDWRQSPSSWGQESTQCFHKE